MLLDVQAAGCRKGGCQERDKQLRLETGLTAGAVFTPICFPLCSAQFSCRPAVLCAFLLIAQAGEPGVVETFKSFYEGVQLRTGLPMAFTATKRGLVTQIDGKEVGGPLLVAASDDPPASARSTAAPSSPASAAA